VETDYPVTMMPAGKVARETINIAREESLRPYVIGDLSRGGGEPAHRRGGQALIPSRISTAARPYHAWIGKLLF